LRSLRNGHPQIGQVNWLDNRVLYFNTYQKYDWGSSMDDDLYRVELDGDPQLILPPGAGGKFALSPDGQHIAVVTAGTYGLVQGRVSLLDPLGARVHDSFHFDAVNTQYEIPFYPPLHWSSDSTAVYLPIPEHELEYPEFDPAMVTLWRAPFEGTGRIYGILYSVLALPEWSGNADRLLYLRQGREQRELVLARGDGQYSLLYASAPMELDWWGLFQWIPDSDQFIYQTENYGNWLVGARGADPQPEISGWAQEILFVSDTTYVYNGSTDHVLYYAQIGEALPHLIVYWGTNHPFDAVLAS
jgi:hypothetical protein